MIVSNALNRLNPRWLPTYALLCALVALPLGVACQKEDAVTDPARLTKEVNLKDDSLKDLDHKRGEGKHDAGIEGHFDKLGIGGETVDRIRNHLLENGITDEQIEQTLAGLLKVVYEMKSEGEEYGLDPRLQDYFGKLGLAHEQIELVQGLARRIVYGLSNSDRERGEGEHDVGIEGHFNKLGISDETVARIRSHLKENGVTDEQIEQTLGGMLRVVHGMKSEGEEYELDPRLRDYFEKLGLTHEQIELVQRVALRLVHGLKDSDRERGEGERETGIEGHFNKLGISDETVDRIRNHLAENGITDEQIEQTLGGMLRVIQGMKSEGEEYELDPWLRDYFEKLGLTHEQIELVQRVALRLVHGLKDSDRERGEG